MIQRRHHSDPRHIALVEARRWLGVRESPAGSNAGYPITEWERALGFGHVPWCGIFLGHCLRHAGVPITSRVASVALIEDDARAGRNGFRRLVSLREAQYGDAVILFGRGVHVELIAAVHRRSGILVTYGGNTSFEGVNASQSDGGCVAHRHRPFSNVYAIARPAYHA